MALFPLKNALTSDYGIKLSKSASGLAQGESAHSNRWGDFLSFEHATPFRLPAGLRRSNSGIRRPFPRNSDLFPDTPSKDPVSETRWPGFWERCEDVRRPISRRTSV
jgi:hypothetical protein